MGSFIKNNWFIVLAVTIIFTVLFFAGKSRITVFPFEKKLESILPEDKENFDFTKTVLNLSALIDANMDVEWTENRINSMAGQLKKEIGDEGNPERIIKAFNTYFFKKESFVFDMNINRYLSAADACKEISIYREELINFHSIEKVLKRKRGICLSISLIYLMLGEKLNLPLYGVLVPNHIYVRYKEPGRSGINVETTYSGAEFYKYDEYSGI